MIRSLVLALGGLAVVVLSGCGSDPVDTPLAGALAEQARKLGTGANQPAPPQNPTRAAVTAAGVPLIRVRVPERGLETFISRRDRNSGTESWFTNDGTVITFRDGVLISTRALVPDLMSAAAPSPAQLLRIGGTHQRSHFLLGDNDRIDRLDFACTMASLGAERLTVIERAYATTHVQESCAGESGEFVNDYWIEGNGFIRQSRQWINPRAGYAEIARLVE